MKSIMREAGLMTAFVILGGLLLLCLWISHHLNQTILRDYKNAQVSVILKPEGETSFKEFLEKSPYVVRFQILRPGENRARLAKTYPELRNLVEPLDSKFFPSSALVTVSQLEAFSNSLKETSSFVESQVIHEPPLALKRFIDVITLIFSGLWILTLSLVLYFNLERIATIEDQKWSLMKMLGAKPLPLFLNLWWGQIFRVTLASLLAIALSIMAVRQIQSFFIWDWIQISNATWVGFVSMAIALTSVISLTLFYNRYKRVPLG